MSKSEKITVKQVRDWLKLEENEPERAKEISGIIGKKFGEHLVKCFENIRINEQLDGMFFALFAKIVFCPTAVTVTEISTIVWLLNGEFKKMFTRNAYKLISDVIKEDLPLF